MSTVKQRKWLIVGVCMGIYGIITPLIAIGYFSKTLLVSVLATVLIVHPVSLLMIYFSYSEGFKDGTLAAVNTLAKNKSLRYIGLRAFIYILYFVLVYTFIIVSGNYMGSGAISAFGPANVYFLFCFKDWYEDGFDAGTGGINRNCPE